MQRKNGEISEDKCSQIFPKGKDVLLGTWSKKWDPMGFLCSATFEVLSEWASKYSRKRRGGWRMGGGDCNMNMMENLLDLASFKTRQT